jgi:hypothetical protein
MPKTSNRVIYACEMHLDDRKISVLDALGHSLK